MRWKYFSTDVQFKEDRIQLKRLIEKCDISYIVENMGESKTKIKKMKYLRSNEILQIRKGKQTE